MPYNEVAPDNRIASGIFSFVHRISDTCARKVPRDDEADNIQAVKNEASIYALLGEDDHIAVCTSVGQTNHVDLKWAVHGNLEDYMRRKDARLIDTFRLRMARQIIEAVGYIHCRGVIHSDLALRQFLLYEDCNARLSDFTASGYQGHSALGMENPSHYMPRNPDYPNSIQSDLFALGSTLYELMVGNTPYDGKTDDEIQLLYERNIFPTTAGILCGDIILDCWKRRFISADEVLDAYNRSLASQNLNSKSI